TRLQPKITIPPAAWEPSFAVHRVDVDSNSDLPKLAQARSRYSCAPRFVQRRKQKANQNCDDADNDEQFNECERSSCFREPRHRALLSSFPASAAAHHPDCA